MKTVLLGFFLFAHCELTGALHWQHTFVYEFLSWRDAQKYCRENFTDLSTIISQNTISWLSSEIKAIVFEITNVDPFYSTNVWVGLKRISTSSWQWSNGLDLNSGIQVQNSNNFLCAKMQYLQLHDSDCTDRFPFLCYNWVPELILVRQNKSWEDALQYCRTHHTDLASLPTYLHLIQVNQTPGISETSSVWTGLRFLAGSWFWLSGEDLEDMDQLPACPANYLYCGSRNWQTQSWENRDCMEKLNFLCY